MSISRASEAASLLTAQPNTGRRDSLTVARISPARGTLFGYMHGELLWRARSRTELENAAKLYIPTKMLTHAWIIKLGTHDMHASIGLRA